MDCEQCGATTVFWPDDECIDVITEWGTTELRSARAVLSATVLVELRIPHSESGQAMHQCPLSSP